MNKEIAQSLNSAVVDKKAVLSLSINQRVALAKKKIEKETLAHTAEIIASEVRMRLAVVFQAMEDLYLNSTEAIDKTMAIVYLYSSQIKELEEINVDTAWLQRILKEQNILDVTDPAPYVAACLTIQREVRRPYSKGLANGLMKFAPVCECVEDQLIDDVLDAAHIAA